MHADCGQLVTLETMRGLEAQHARLAGAWTLEIGSHFDVVVAPWQKHQFMQCG